MNLILIHWKRFKEFIILKKHFYRFLNLNNFFDKKKSFLNIFCITYKSDSNLEGIAANVQNTKL